MTGASGLFPPWAAEAAAAITAASGPLWPEEEKCVAAAVSRRRAEFIAGRVLARRALAELGAASGPIPAAADRSPIWPTGFIGSISHAGSHAIAVVAKTSNARSLGVDIEEIGRFEPGLEAYVLTPEEIALNLEGSTPAERRTTAALLFSAKEAFYKCQYPLSRTMLDFHDVCVRMNRPTRTFELRLLRSVEGLSGQTEFTGRYRLGPDRVATGVVIDAEADGDGGRAARLQA